MSTQRIFQSQDFMQPSQGDPIRSVVTQTEHAVIVAWHVQPGQRIAAHVHPEGQDTWTILSGEGDYQIDQAGTVQAIKAGDIVVAPKGHVHGVLNTGSTPLVFVSVVCPDEAGYELLG